MSHYVCVTEGCDRPVLVKVRGLCSAHYQRWQRHGDPDHPVTTARPSLRRHRVRRLRDHPAPTPLDTPCRLWQGEVVKGGYGRKWIQNQRVPVHRWIWEQLNGPIPSDMIVMHRCDNPPCYRLDHLRLGTQADNMADKVSKGRSNNRLLLTDEQVTAIRQDPRPQVQIAVDFGISQGYVSALKRRISRG